MVMLIALLIRVKHYKLYHLNRLFRKGPVFQCTKTVNGPKIKLYSETWLCIIDNLMYSWTYKLQWRLLCRKINVFCFILFSSTVSWHISSPNKYQNSISKFNVLNYRSYLVMNLKRKSPNKSDATEYYTHSGAPDSYCSTGRYSQSTITPEWMQQ